MGLTIDASVYNSIGRRANNEDSFYINGTFMKRDQMDKGGKYHGLFTDTQQIFAVCDGMGGAEFGEEASYRAVSSLKVYQDKCVQPDKSDNLKRMISKLSADVDRISLSQDLSSGSCGTTIAMLICKDWYYRIAHVGDSRIYLLRKGTFSRLTRDDSLVQDLVDAGRITEDEAWSHPRKNVITRHLGMPTGGAPLYPTISERAVLMEGDRFLICSDGLSDALHDRTLQDILSTESTSQDAAERLANTALTRMDEAKTASDNITAIVLDVMSVSNKNTVRRRTLRWRLIRDLSGILALAGLAGFAINAVRLTRLLMR